MFAFSAQILSIAETVFPLVPVTDLHIHGGRVFPCMYFNEKKWNTVPAAVDVYVQYLIRKLG